MHVSTSLAAARQRGHTAKNLEGRILRTDSPQMATRETRVSSKRGRRATAVRTGKFHSETLMSQYQENRAMDAHQTGRDLSVCPPAGK